MIKQVLVRIKCLFARVAVCVYLVAHTRQKGDFLANLHLLTKLDFFFFLLIFLCFAMMIFACLGSSR